MVALPQYSLRRTSQQICWCCNTAQQLEEPNINFNWCRFTTVEPLYHGTAAVLCGHSKSTANHTAVEQFEVTYSKSITGLLNKNRRKYHRIFMSEYRYLILKYMQGCTVLVLQQNNYSNSWKNQSKSMHCLYHINKLPNRMNVSSEVTKYARIQNKDRLGQCQNVHTKDA